MFCFYPDTTQVFWQQFSLHQFQSAKYVAFWQDHWLKRTSTVLAFLLLWLVSWVQAAGSVLIAAEDPVWVPGFQTTGRGLFLAGEQHRYQLGRHPPSSASWCWGPDFHVLWKKTLLKWFFYRQLRKDHALVV